MANTPKGFTKGIAVQNETDRSKQLLIDVDNTASSGTSTTLKSKQTLNRTLELPNVSGELVEKDAAQTLTNKTIDGDNNTIQDVALSSLKTVLADADKFVSRDVSGQVVSTKAVPVGTVVGTSDSQTLTNKTIDADLNTISNIENADIKVGAAIDAAKIHDGSVSNTEFGYLNGVTSAIQTQLDAKAEIAGATDNRLVKTDGASDIQQTGITVDDSNNVTGVNDLTVDGNLTVNGTTTTVNTATLDVEDKNITVNFNGTDVTAEGAGLTVDRTGTSGSLVYEDALASKWKAGALGSEVEVANVSSSQTLTNKNLKSNTNLLTGASVDSIQRETGNQMLVFIPDATLANDFVLNQHPQVISNKDIEGGTASNTNRLTVPNNTLSNLLALTRKEAVIVYGTDTDKLYVDDGSTLKEIGSGSGAKNFISNGDAEANTLGWATYADVAGTRPVDGTGGSPSVTFTRSTSSPLEGQGSFLFTKDAVNRQGQGASYDFTIDPAYRAKVLNIEMDYVVSSGTFVAGSNSADSDVIVYIYDVTNSTLIEPSSIKFFSNSSTISDKFSATFQTSATGSTYRLILHCASTSANAYVLKFDNIQVSPSEYVYGTPVTDWQTYTPTGSWVTNATYTGRWRRVGDTMEVQANIATSGAPTATNLTVNIPSGFSIDTSKIVDTTANLQALGFGSSNDSGATYYKVFAAYSSTSSIQVRYQNSATGSSVPVANNLPFTYGAGDSVNITFIVPIVGWSSSVQTSDRTDTRVVAAVFSGSTTSITSGGNAVVPTNVLSDTHGAFSGSTFTVPSSGFYDFSGTIRFTNAVYAVGDSVTLFVRINGSTDYLLGQYRITSTANLNYSTSGSFSLSLNAGNTVQFVAASTVTNTLSGANGFYGSIRRVSGPQAIAATETIAASYTNTSGQSIPNNTQTTITGWTRQVDTHNSFSTSGVFTAPASGLYQACLSVAFPSGYTANTGAMVSVLNPSAGVAVATTIPFGSNNIEQGVLSFGIFQLLAGQTITTQVIQSNGVARSLFSADGSRVRFSINRIGN